MEYEQVKHKGDSVKNLPDLWSPFSEQSLDEVRKAIPAVVDRWIYAWEPSSVLVVGLFSELLTEELARRSVEVVCIEPGALMEEKAVEIVDLSICLEALREFSLEEESNAIAHLCQCSDAIIFSYHPFEGRTPGYWAASFAEQGFYRDLSYEVNNLLPWAVCYQQASRSLNQICEIYENYLCSLQREAKARRQLGIQQVNTNIAQQGQIDTLNRQINTLNKKTQSLEGQLKGATAEVEAWRERWQQLEASIGWPLLKKLQNLRANLAPPGSTREYWLEVLFGKRPLNFSFYRAHGETIDIKPVSKRLPPPDHTATVDIIICVHNALEDVQRCLASVVEHTTQPYRLVLIDDGSAPPTRDFLADFAAEHGATLFRNEKAAGYTFAANRGLRASQADFALLLNSDTVVTPRWLDRMMACAESDPRIGMVGPLSNTASWQSIPALSNGDDWAKNPLPEGMSVAEMGDWVAKVSGRIYPRRALLNGFCLLLRQAMLEEIGAFDEKTFGAGYGEEDDLALRARAAGWELALADDAYVYHAQSRSYTDTRRKQLSERAGERLRAKHGSLRLEKSVSACAHDRIISGIRARARIMFERREIIQQGSEHFAGLKVLFVLPVDTPGGGANIVISEARAMRAMNVEVKLFNLPEYRIKFERAYPDLTLPIIYGTREELPKVARRYDAVIATYNPSVAWLEPISGQIVRAYYIQGFEPLMYKPETDGYRVALDSYTKLPDLVRFTKTEWTRKRVYDETGVNSMVVGPSFELDLFRPRPRMMSESGLLRIAAMIRPESPYRAPELTMRLLKQAMQRYSRRVEAWIFGTTSANSGFQELPRDFGWRLAGILSPGQVASFLNETDIFVDFSTHQAMGLTAMEAMGCGNAVVVPESGGATSFANHEKNSLVVDTTSETACWEALNRLIIDDGLRHRLQSRATNDICMHFPERAAFNVLKALVRARTQ
jgi:GT2 family glycosyltransferase/glycosyltransferase involved in cell wall biosynthesis